MGWWADKTCLNTLRLFRRNYNHFTSNVTYTRGGVWFVFSNNHFQFLNNISRIFTHFFIHTYFYKCFKQQFSVFKHMYQMDRRYFTNCILQTADISCSTSAFLKLKNIARNTNYFTKKFTNY